MKSALRVLVTITLVGMGLFLSSVPAEAGAQVACFRILHASPDAPNLDVYINRTRVANNLAYAQFSARRWCIAATIMLARAFPANADPNVTPSLVSTNVELMVGRSYVIAVADSVQQLQVVALEDPAPPPAGQFSLRLAHLAVGVGEVDLAVTGGSVWLSNVVFPTAQTTTQPAGTYALEIRQAGTPDVLVPLGPLKFRPRDRQTIYVLAPSAAARAQDATAAPQIIVAPDR
jgi:hypothetical protein